jgi:lysozyme family protein
MQENFAKAYRKTIAAEGGFSQHPLDPGGATMKGVTLNRYSAYLGRQATVEELKAIPEEHLLAIYGQGYWDKCRCDDLPSGLDVCVFDWAVNSGPGRAVKALQELAGVKPDGDVGPKTLAAVASWWAYYGPKTCIAMYQNERMEYLEDLSTFKVFGNGWTKRVIDMENFAYTLV